MTSPRPLAALFEIALAGAVAATFVLALRFFLAAGYLPQPFLVDTNDTFMDWFNPAYWANNRGVYEVWGSIYPPLSFAFLDLFSLPGCYLQSPFHGRDCDWLGRIAIGLGYLLTVALAWLAFRRGDRPTAPMRTLAFALGMPLLFTLDRGNLVLVTLPCFILAFGNILRSRAGQAVATALAINFKPYLLLAAAAFAVKREWRALELAGLATVAVYLVTLAWVGSGTPAELMANTTAWIVYQGAMVWNEVNYSTSYTPFLMFGILQMPVLDFVPSRVAEGIALLVPAVIRTSQGIAALALAAAWLQPGAVPRARIAAIVLGTYFIARSPGGYAQAFLVFLVFLEPWRRPGPILALVCAYLLCLVGDVPLARILEMRSESWLSGRPVSPAFGLNLGHLVRPGLVVAIVWALAFDTVAEVVRAHRRHRPVLGLTQGLVPA
jgi:hypothetical protein